MKWRFSNISFPFLKVSSFTETFPMISQNQNVIQKRQYKFHFKMISRLCYFCNKNNHKVQSVCQLTCVLNLVYLFLQHRTVISIYISTVATQSVGDHKYYLHKALYTYFFYKYNFKIFSSHRNNVLPKFVIIFFRKSKINWNFFVLVLIFLRYQHFLVVLKL